MANTREKRYLYCLMTTIYIRPDKKGVPQRSFAYRNQECGSSWLWKDMILPLLVYFAFPIHNLDGWSDSVGYPDVASQMCATEARKWRRGYMFMLPFRHKYFCCWWTANI